MSDHLQIEHWMTRLVEALRADTTLQARGYRLVEIGDLEYGYVSTGLLEHLPALLVSCRGEIEIMEQDVHGEAERYGYPLRVVALHTFEEPARVLALKSALMGELQGAIRAVQFSSERFDAPTDQHQFFFLEPLGFELDTAEEDLVQAAQGYENTIAIAVRYRLVASSRIER